MGKRELLVRTEMQVSGRCARERRSGEILKENNPFTNKYGKTKRSETRSRAQREGRLLALRVERVSSSEWQRQRPTNRFCSADPCLCTPNKVQGKISSILLEAPTGPVWDLIEGGGWRKVLHIFHQVFF